MTAAQGRDPAEEADLFLGPFHETAAPKRVFPAGINSTGPRDLFSGLSKRLIEASRKPERPCTTCGGRGDCLGMRCPSCQGTRTVPDE